MQDTQLDKGTTLVGDSLPRVSTDTQFSGAVLNVLNEATPFPSCPCRRSTRTMYETHRGISVQQAGHSLAALTVFRGEGGREERISPAKIFPRPCRGCGRWLALPFALGRRSPAPARRAAYTCYPRTACADCSLSIQYSSFSGPSEQPSGPTDAEERTNFVGKSCDVVVSLHCPYLPHSSLHHIPRELRSVHM